MYYLKPLVDDTDDDFLPPWPDDQNPSVGVAVPAPPTDADAGEDLPTPQIEEEGMQDDENLEEEKEETSTDNESVIDVSEGESIPVLEPPTPRTTRSGRTSKPSAFMKENYEFLGSSTDK
eukprot:5594495-Ditylum_brightwellii.AAC.1